MNCEWVGLGLHHRSHYIFRSRQSAHHYRDVKAPYATESHAKAFFLRQPAKDATDNGRQFRVLVYLGLHPPK